MVILLIVSILGGYSKKCLDVFVLKKKKFYIFLFVVKDDVLKLYEVE